MPNFAALGPRLGRRVNDVKAALAGADGDALRRQLEDQGFVEVAGERLVPAEVEVRAERQSDIALAQDGTWAVALDLDLDDDLRREGTARELVRALNDLRREQDFAIAERIDVSLATSDQAVRAAVEAHGDAIATEVLATSLELVDEELAAGLEIDGAPVGARLSAARGGV